MSTMILFSQGPQLLISLTFIEGQWVQSSLKLANQFSCSINGDVKSSLKDNLICFLENYGKGIVNPLEIPIQNLTPFRRKVLKRMQQIPFGSTMTYGELAAAIDQPKAARAIGGACHHNPFPLFIPCHRVVASQGKLGGFACDPEIKTRLLKFELEQIHSLL